MARLLMGEERDRLVAMDPNALTEEERSAVTATLRYEAASDRIRTLRTREVRPRFFRDEIALEAMKTMLTTRPKLDDVNIKRLAEASWKLADAWLEAGEPVEKTNGAA